MATEGFEARATFSRRRLLAALTGAAAGAILAACAQPAATPTPAPTAAPQPTTPPAAAPTSAPAATPTTAPAAATATPAPKPTAAPAPTTAPTVQPAASKAVGLVKYWSWWSPAASKPMADWDAYVRQEFVAKNSGAQLEVSFVPFGDYWKKFLAAVAANDVPDALHSSIAWGRDLYDLNTLLELNDYMKATPDLDPTKLIPVTTLYNQKAGRFYGASWEGPDGRAMLYNVDLLKAAGIDPDPASVKKWTWDDLLQNALKLTKRAGDQVEVAGFLVWVWLMQDLAGWLYTIDGKFYADDAMTKASFADGDKAAQALQFALDLLNKHKVSLPLSAERQDESLFYQGKVAIGPGMLFAVGRYEAQKPANLHWDYAPWPQGPGGKGVSGAVFANMHTIPTKAKNRDGAWQFISWYCGLDTALAKLKIQGMLSPRKDFYDTKEWKDRAAQTPQLLRVLEIASGGGLVPFVRQTRMTNAATPVLQAAFLGKADPKAAMRDLQQQVNEILAGPPDA